MHWTRAILHALPHLIPSWTNELESWPLLYTVEDWGPERLKDVSTQKASDKITWSVDLPSTGCCFSLCFNYHIWWTAWHWAHLVNKCNLCLLAGISQPQCQWGKGELGYLYLVQQPQTLAKGNSEKWLQILASRKMATVLRCAPKVHVLVAWSLMWQKRGGGTFKRWDLMVDN